MFCSNVSNPAGREPILIVEITIMTYEKEKFFEAENIGFAERIVRGYISIAIIMAIVLIPAINAYTLFGLTQIAIYVGLTAFVGWDPVYAVLKRKITNVPVRAGSEDVSYPKHEETPIPSIHKRAA